VIELRTLRLRLVAGTLETARAEVNDREGLARLLDAVVPPDWPPPLNDANSARYFLDYLTKHPTAVGWMMWYFIRTDDGRAVAIGNGGFKGEPSAGSVEIGYSIVPQYQRRGFAGEAVQALLAWAIGHDSVQRVIAETLPESRASQALLRKLGFAEIEPSEPGVLRFQLEARKVAGGL
jgi:ribosomal-protein-alanine N-acetyltransferase